MRCFSGADGVELSDEAWLHIYSSTFISRLKRSHVEFFFFLPKPCSIISIGVIEAFVRRVRLREGVTSQRSTTGDMEGLISPSLPKQASHTLP